MISIPDLCDDVMPYSAADLEWHTRVSNQGDTEAAGPDDRPPLDCLIPPLDDRALEDLAEQARWDDLMSRGFLPY